MKKILLICFAVIGLAFTANAQERTKIKDGLYLVSYGKSVVIEDEVNQRSISMEIAQEGIDQRNGEMVYNVVCGKWTKRVVKLGLKSAVAAGIKAAALTEGASLAVSAAAELANWIYDDVCEYYGEKYK
jgi:hypothetical protein